MAVTQLLLGVNIDHVATLRQARGEGYPDPIQAAFVAEQAGADGITAHLREDRRHIQDRDIRLLLEVLATRLNLEMAMTEEMLGLAERLQPTHCCLVPERRAELTTEGGLDVANDLHRARAACRRMADAGVTAALFIDPEAVQIQAAAEAGATAVELHTGHYAQARDADSVARELGRLSRAIELARGYGLIVNAGHGLHYHNVRLVAGLPGLAELNIGHAIIARAVMTGLDEAVREIKRLMHAGLEG